MNIKYGIITGENSKIVHQRAEKIKADYCFLGVGDKFAFINEFCTKEDVLLNEIAYIGDDTNDLEIMQNIGISFAVNDSHNEIKKIAHFICQNSGGKGAFREAVEFIIKKINSISSQKNEN